MRTAKPASESAKSLEIYEYLNAYLSEHHYSPSIREIMLHIDSGSSSLVVYYLDKLEDEGWIKRDPHVSRSIVVTK